MTKRTTKTVEQLTEEFFAAERAEYEKRVSAAFPRVETAEAAEPAVEEEKKSGGEEETPGGGDAGTRGRNRE